MSTDSGTKDLLHVYAKLEGVKPKGGFDLTFGRYVKAPGFIYRKEEKKDFRTESSLIHEFAKKTKGKRIHVLVYIHGFLAENPWFASLSGSVLHQRIFDVEKHDVTLVISLQWDSGWDYRQNRSLAHEKGLVFGAYIRSVVTLLETAKKPVVVSCIAHSMGNIVLDGILQYQAGFPTRFPWNHLFLCAADMPSDHFYRGYKYLPDMARHTHIFYHEEDKTLQVAHRFLPFPRLGIVGRQDDLMFRNVYDINVTDITFDDDALGSSFSHHRYFYGSQHVVNYINAALAGKVKNYEGLEKWLS